MGSGFKRITDIFMPGSFIINNRFDTKCWECGGALKEKTLVRYWPKLRTATCIDCKIDFTDTGSEPW